MWVWVHGLYLGYVCTIPKSLYAKFHKARFNICKIMKILLRVVPVLVWVHVCGLGFGCTFPNNQVLYRQLQQKFCFKFESSRPNISLRIINIIFMGVLVLARVRCLVLFNWARPEPVYKRLSSKYESLRSHRSLRTINILFNGGASAGVGTGS